MLGSDPELLPEGQHLSNVRWFLLATMAEDHQVRLVVAALRGNA